MTFDPLDLLAFAEAIDQSSEASCRSVVNRAYYGVFLKTRDNLVAKKLFEPNNDGTDHGRLVRTLRDKRRRPAGDQLNALREKRDRADYDTSNEVSPQLAQDALAIARKITEFLAQDWAS